MSRLSNQALGSTVQGDFPVIAKFKVDLHAAVAFSPQRGIARSSAHQWLARRGVSPYKPSQAEARTQFEVEDDPPMRRITTLSIALTSLALSGCQSLDDMNLDRFIGLGEKNSKVNRELAASQVTTIGVNSYLWRASLDTVSFMPLLSADSGTGVIITDWYVNPASPAERMKLTIMILDTNLRADALRVSAARQVAQGGQWVDAPVQAATVQKLENIILSRARDLRRDATLN